MVKSVAQITEYLIKFRSGDPRAVEEMFPLVYEELRQIARGMMKKENPGHTLQPTILVHEAFLRLTGGIPVSWQDRAHFFAVAAQVMRRILIDWARAKKADKRGGDNLRVEFEEALHASLSHDPNLLELDEALRRLEAMDEKLCRIVEMRYFTGMTIDEIAEAVGRSPATVKREWSRAKLWLYRELKS